MSEKTLETVEEVVEKEVAETVEEVVEKSYTLRDLKNSDLWTVVKILGKLLPDDLKKAFVQVASGKKKLNEIGVMVGIDIVTMIIQNAHLAQKEVDDFCADMAGITVEELSEMEFGTTPMIIMDIFNDAKNVSFFKVLSKLFS